MKRIGVARISIDPLAREMRELIAHGDPAGGRFAFVLAGLSTALRAKHNVTEEVAAVLVARRHGVEVEDETPFQEQVQAEVDRLLAHAGHEALKLLVNTVQRKRLMRRMGRPRKDTEEDQRQARLHGRSSRTRLSAAAVAAGQRARTEP